MDEALGAVSSVAPDWLGEWGPFAVLMVLLFAVWLFTRKIFAVQKDGLSLERGVVGHYHVSYGKRAARSIAEPSWLANECGNSPVFNIGDG